MKITVKPAYYIAGSFALMIAGIFFIIYSFELVSVPHIIEYNESYYLIFGLLLFLAGLAAAFFRFFSKKKKSLPDLKPDL